MIRYLLGVILLCSGISKACGESVSNSLIERHWFEARTGHFHIYSCGATQEVAKLSARLEQFREAYAHLAGTNAVASPPIVVLAFPDHESMLPFLPLYQDKPVNLAAFFHRGSDENLIVLALATSSSSTMEIIFHEYTHLLLRHNDRVWPMWLKEGMAEIYATFEPFGRGARIGKPIAHHLRLLTKEPLMPLAELFGVDHDSPQYNEREHQGMFYAESWLLTHYLMSGANPAYKARFGQLTVLLRLGQRPEQAFTNAFHTTLPAMEAELRRYLERDKFESLPLVVNADLSSPRSFATRGITPVETCFRLGDELVRIDRLDAAEPYFLHAKKLGPASPLPFEGLGLVAAQRHKSEEAVHLFQESFQHGSTNFLSYYVSAHERLKLTSNSTDTYTTVKKEVAAEIRSELQKSVALMPDFGPAHHMLGFFEAVQGEDLNAAEQHLKRAIQLEPENQWYLLSLAQAQMARKDYDAARRTLEPLRLPYIEAKLRSHAEELIKEIGHPAAHQP
jgi:tetratricopeptide (TPR) repeat protein